MYFCIVFLGKEPTNTEINIRDVVESRAGYTLLAAGTVYI